MTQSVLREKAVIIESVCRTLSDAGTEAATAILHREYKFDPEPIVKRKYGPMESTRVFARDGFIDRYTGTRVVFPPVFRVLSMAMPEDFPYHPAVATAKLILHARVFQFDLLVAAASSRKLCC